MLGVAPEDSPEAEPCDGYQRLVATAWNLQGEPFEALIRDHQRSVFRSRALAHFSLEAGLPPGDVPDKDLIQRLANHLNDAQQYRLANRLYATLQAEGRLRRGSALAYASSYSEEHADVEGAAIAIAMVERLLGGLDVEFPDSSKLDAVVAHAECWHRLAGLRQWYWQQTRDVADLDVAIQALATAVEWNDRARQLGGLRHPGFLAQSRLKLLVLLRTRKGTSLAPTWSSTVRKS